MAFRLIVIGLILTMSIPAAGHDDTTVIAANNECNSQHIEDDSGTKLMTVYWTSSFSNVWDDEAESVRFYKFEQEGRDGPAITGHGELLNVTVEWTAVPADSTKSVRVAAAAKDVELRPAGFTPGGANGTAPTPAVATHTLPPLPTNDTNCGPIDRNGAIYGRDTFEFYYTALHKPANRGGRDADGAAKGNAAVNMFVDVTDPDGTTHEVALGTNVHVSTAEDPEG